MDVLYCEILIHKKNRLQIEFHLKLKKNIKGNSSDLIILNVQSICLQIIQTICHANQ